MIITRSQNTTETDDSPRMTQTNVQLTNLVAQVMRIATFTTPPATRLLTAILWQNTARKCRKRVIDEMVERRRGKARAPRNTI